jgi:hypothetical protein
MQGRAEAAVKQNAELAERAVAAFQVRARLGFRETAASSLSFGVPGASTAGVPGNSSVFSLICRGAELLRRSRGPHTPIRLAHHADNSSLPILRTPLVCFRGGGFPNPSGPVSSSRRRAAERRHPTGPERMGSPTLQTLQDPILLPPWVCFAKLRRVLLLLGQRTKLCTAHVTPGVLSRVRCVP